MDDREDALAWVELSKEAFSGSSLEVPPSFMMFHQDLLDQAGWGKRLLPYDSFVGWDQFKNYLVDYFKRNAAEEKPAEDDALKDAAEQKPDQAGQHTAAIDDALKVAANLCLDWENKLFQGYFGDLSIDDMKLIAQITKQAKEMIKSSAHQSVTATVGMKCIAKEAELMLKFLESEYDTNKMVIISNKIRRSVLNLMLSNGSNSAAAAGAMLGATREAVLFLDVLSQAAPDNVHQYDLCNRMRRYIALVLTKLEKELSCDTDAANNTPDMGFSSSSMIARD